MYITLYQDNIYAVGGNDGISSLDKCEKYDPLLNKWTFIAPMNRHRAGAGVAELDGYLYVVGKEFREKKVRYMYMLRPEKIALQNNAKAGTRVLFILYCKIL